MDFVKLDRLLEHTCFYIYSSVFFLYLDLYLAPCATLREGRHNECGCKTGGDENFMPNLPGSHTAAVGMKCEAMKI
jgi:hypothetical protein